MLVITKLKNFFNEAHENINRSYEKPYYENLIRQQRAPKEIENYFNSMELKIPELLQCLAELKIDKDFTRPDLVIANEQFSYNYTLYQLLIIQQPTY